MSGDLQNMLRGLMARVVKSSVLKDANTAFQIANVDMKDDNILPYNKVDLGFSADKCLKRLVVAQKINERKSVELEMDCRKFLVVSIKKLLNKCPLKYSLVRFSACLDPRRMAEKPEECRDHFQRVLVKLEACNLVKETDCDATKRQYQNFLETVVVSSKRSFSSFDLKEERLDEFLQKHTREDDHLLWSVMKIILTLSHGQATVERGFSVNSQIVVENRKAASYMAQRVVHDHVSSAGGIGNVKLDKPLLLSVQSSRQKYMIDQEKKKMEREETERDRKRKAHLQDMSEVKEKKRKLDEDLKALIEACDEYSQKMEKTGKREWFTKYNAIRATVKEKEKEEQDIELVLNDMDKKRF